MKKILFVCLGNICRSPLAEGIMLHLKEKHKLKIEIDSAGTSDYHIGEAPDKRTIINARKNGIDLSELRARQFEVVDFEKFDRIFVMDQSNYANVLALSKDPLHHKKVSLPLPSSGNTGLTEVPDPYFGGEETFEKVFDLLYTACDNLCLQVLKS